MPNPNNLTYFTFLQWNCRSLTANLEDLAFLLSSHSPDIICLSEIWLKNSSRFSFPGFHIIASHRTGPGGGAAILVTRNLSFSVINDTRIKNLCSSNNIHIPIVRISLNDKPTYIVFLYPPLPQFLAIIPHLPICGPISFLYFPSSHLLSSALILTVDTRSGVSLTRSPTELASSL